MRKLFVVVVLMFLIVTSVSAEENYYQNILDNSGIDSILQPYENRFDGGYYGQTVQAAQDNSWLTKRWVDAYGNCLIKGNISYKSGDKIYHIPGWKDYAATKINTSYGERWFCTEWEAYKAGWRAPYYANRPKVYPNPY